jgi:hypothetical protein
MWWCLTFIVLCCVLDLFVWVWWCLTFIVLCCVTTQHKTINVRHHHTQTNKSITQHKTINIRHAVLLICLFGCGGVWLLFSCVVLLICFFGCGCNTTQDNKRQTPPHTNKQINNTTQDNKRQAPPHPNKQIKKFWCGGVWCLLSFLVLFICLFGCGGVWRLLSCVVFLFCLSSSCVLCTQCCQFLWIIHSFMELTFDTKWDWRPSFSINMRQVQPETLPKNSNFSSCLQNIKLKNNTT